MVEATPDPQIEWLLNGRIIKDSVASQTFVKGLCTLQLRDLLPSDGGEYVCKAKNSAGEETSLATVHVRVIDKSAQEKKVGDPPCVVTPLEGLVVKDGDPVTMSCEISGSPKPEVIWLHDGKKVEDCEEFSYENKGELYKLVFAEVFPEDAGVYTCEASNIAGRTCCSCTLKVEVPDEEVVGPVFTTFPQSLSVEEGTPVKFSCSFENNSVKVVWKKNGTEIENTGRFKFFGNGNKFSFEIPAALETDTGVYCVLASDGVDSDSQWTFSLNVTVTDTAGTAHVDVQELLKSIQ